MRSSLVSKKTFRTPTSDAVSVTHALQDIVETLQKTLRRNDARAGSLALAIRYETGDKKVQTKILPRPTRSHNYIYTNSLKLLTGVISRNGKKIRTMELSLRSLVSGKALVGQKS